jgi:hypothetical protein
VFRQICGASPTEYRQEFSLPRNDNAPEQHSYNAGGFASETTSK